MSPATRCPDDETTEPRAPPSGERSSSEYSSSADPRRLELITQVIATARPAVQADGGDLELDAVVGDVVRVRLSGACTHCGMAGHTLGGLRRQLTSALGTPVRVLPAS